jgi:hypothetical protein
MCREGEVVACFEFHTVMFLTESCTVKQLKIVAIITRPAAGIRTQNFLNTELICYPV